MMRKSTLLSCALSILPLGPDGGASAKKKKKACAMRTNALLTRAAAARAAEWPGAGQGLARRRLRLLPRALHNWSPKRRGRRRGCAPASSKRSFCSSERKWR